MILIIYNVLDKKNGNVFYECLNYSSKNMKLLFSHIHKKYKIIDTNDIRHKKNIGMNFFHKKKTRFEVLSKLLNFFIFKDIAHFMKPYRAPVVLWNRLYFCLFHIFYFIHPLLNPLYWVRRLYWEAVLKFSDSCQII